MNKSNLPTYSDLDFWLQVRQIRPVFPKIIGTQFLPCDSAVKVALQGDAMVSWEWLAVIRPRPDRAPIGIAQNSSDFRMIPASKGEYFFVCFD